LFVQWWRGVPMKKVNFAVLNLYFRVAEARRDALTSTYGILLPPHTDYINTIETLKNLLDNNNAVQLLSSLSFDLREWTNEDVKVRICIFYSCDFVVAGIPSNLAIYYYDTIGCI
jgi:hypothetical protein